MAGTKGWESELPFIKLREDVLASSRVLKVKNVCGNRSFYCIVKTNILHSPAKKVQLLVTHDACLQSFVISMPRFVITMIIEY